jgi:hypothetical protein
MLRSELWPATPLFLWRDILNAATCQRCGQPRNARNLKATAKAETSASEKP